MSRFGAIVRPNHRQAQRVDRAIAQARCVPGSQHDVAPWLGLFLTDLQPDIRLRPRAIIEPIVGEILARRISPHLDRVSGG